MEEILNFIFTETMYILMGKLFTLWVFWRMLKLLHTKAYTKIHVYSYTFDVIALPFHYMNIAFFLMPAKVISWYKVTSTLEKPNKNFIWVTYWLYKRLVRLGYNAEEINNIRIEYSNSLKK